MWRPYADAFFTFLISYDFRYRLLAEAVDSIVTDGICIRVDLGLPEPESNGIPEDTSRCNYQIYARLDCFFISICPPEPISKNVNYFMLTFFIRFLFNIEHCIFHCCTKSQTCSSCFIIELTFRCIWFYTIYKCIRVNVLRTEYIQLPDFNAD